MKCPFKCVNKDDIPFLDNPVEHLIITVNKDSHIHIHGPFGNEFVIAKMADAFWTEMRKNGINYIPVVQQDKE